MQLTFIAYWGSIIFYKVFLYYFLYESLLRLYFFNMNHIHRADFCSFKVALEFFITEFKNNALFVITLFCWCRKVLVKYRRFIVLLHFPDLRKDSFA